MRSLSGCFDGLEGCRSAAMPNCSSRLLDLADGEQDVKASRRFLRSWLSWSDARLRRASSELEKLGWLCRKSSVTPAGDRAATEWRLPRIVIQTSETVRVEGVSYTGHGVPRKDTVSRTGQSRPHKQNTQEGGIARARARARQHDHRADSPNPVRSRANFSRETPGPNSGRTR